MPFDMIKNTKPGSNVAAYGIDGDKVQIEYKNGRQYVYDNVSPKMAQTLEEANEIGNLGSYVANVLKEGRAFKEVERVLPREPQEEDNAG